MIYKVPSNSSSLPWSSHGISSLRRGTQGWCLPVPELARAWDCFHAPGWQSCGTEERTGLMLQPPFQPISLIPTHPIHCSMPSCPIPFPPIHLILSYPILFIPPHPISSHAIIIPISPSDGEAPWAALGIKWEPQQSRVGPLWLMLPTPAKEMQAALELAVSPALLPPFLLLPRQGQQGVPARLAPTQSYGEGEIQGRCKAARGTGEPIRHQHPPTAMYKGGVGGWRSFLSS